MRIAAGATPDQGDIDARRDRLRAAAGEPLAAMLVAEGNQLVAMGAAADVVAAIERLPPQRCDPAMAELAAHALLACGDWAGAWQRLRRAVPDLTPRGDRTELPAGLAWRLGALHYARCDLNGALDALRRGRVDGAAKSDEALLLSWTAAALWLRREPDECRTLAAAGLAAAVASQDDAALAAAYLAAGMAAAVDGDGPVSIAHYHAARRHAERAGDHLSLARIRNNLGSRHLEEGRFEEALAELAGPAQPPPVEYEWLTALTHHNRGEAHLGLGRLDEAERDFIVARDTFRRWGSRMIAYPLLRLGQVHRERGDAALAQAAYEEGLHHATQVGDRQAIVPALAGLARVVASRRQAEQLVRDALVGPAGPGAVEAELAGGWLALRAGNRTGARGYAARAARQAATRANRSALAEALELGALAADRPPDETAGVRQAAGLWRAMGNELGAARNALLLARLEGRTTDGCEERLRGLGVRLDGTQVAGALAVVAELSPAVEIRGLGGFQVLRSGRPVPLEEWRSKKARDLLKILLTRRRTTFSRERLMALLWPDEADAGNRLSVALSNLRSVLDPEHRFPAGWFVRADRECVALSHVRIDSECFLDAADRALNAARQHAPEAAEELLALVEGYPGDFLADTPYADWAAPMREEIRAVHHAVLAALTVIAVEADDHHLAVRCLLRSLDDDPYDEQAHLTLIRLLVNAGRHGEAGRRYTIYGERMAELGIAAAPYPTRPTGSPSSVRI